MEKVLQELFGWIFLGAHCLNCTKIHLDAVLARQTEAQTDVPTDKQKDRQTDIQIERQVDRQTDRQMD